MCVRRACDLAKSHSRWRGMCITINHYSEVLSTLVFPPFNQPNATIAKVAFQASSAGAQAPRVPSGWGVCAFVGQSACLSICLTRASRGRSFGHYRFSHRVELNLLSDLCKWPQLKLFKFCTINHKAFHLLTFEQRQFSNLLSSRWSV